MRFLVLAGTRDGRLIAQDLVACGYEVLVSTLTEYGAELAESEGLSVRYGAFTSEELNQVLQEESFSGVIDATHPYALKIQATAQAACTRSATAYFRWERPATDGFPPREVYWAENITEAAEIAAGLGERILLTTGSNHLADWLDQAALKEKTVFVRVLPTAKVLQRCEELGLKPYQIIAAQGPFSQAWNEAMMTQLGIQVVVAKDSGKEGGTPAKIVASRNLAVPIILLRRPSGVQFSLSRCEFIKKVENEVWKQKSFS